MKITHTKIHAMFAASDLLDLSQCPCPELFPATESVWEALRKLPGWIKQNLRPARHCSTVGVPYIAEDVSIGEGTVVEHGAVILGPTIIGANCQIRSSAYVRGNVVVGNGCVLGNASEFKNSILFNESQAPHFSYVGDSILGHKAHLGAGVILSNLKSIKSSVKIKHDGNETDTGLRKLGAIIGDGADVGCNCVLSPGSIIGRNSILYPNIFWRGVCASDSIAKLRQQQEVIVRRK